MLGFHAISAAPLGALLAPAAGGTDVAVDVTGVSATGLVGDELVTGDARVEPSGTAGTGAVGGVTVEGDAVPAPPSAPPVSGGVWAGVPLKRREPRRPEPVPELEPVGAWAVAIGVDAGVAVGAVTAGADAELTVAGCSARVAAGPVELVTELRRQDDERREEELSLVALLAA